MPATARPSAFMGLPSVVFGAALLGFAAVFVKWGLAGGASPLVVGFYRMLLALPAIAWLVQKEGGHTTSRGRWWALLAGAAFAGDLSFWHRSMQHTSAANSTFIVCGLSPVWVALFSAAVYRTRYRVSAWLGQSLGVTGALILALTRGARVGSGKGEAFAAAASVCYACFSLTITQSRKNATARQSLLWMSLGSLLTFGFLELFEQEPLYGFTLQAWLGMLGLALLVQWIAWLFINSGLGRVDVALGALALGFQQVATPFLAAWLLHEPLRPMGLLGGAIILVGIYLVATGEQARHVSRST